MSMLKNVSMIPVVIIDMANFNDYVGYSMVNALIKSYCILQQEVALMEDQNLERWNHNFITKGYIYIPCVIILTTPKGHAKIQIKIQAQTQVDYGP